jgi:hypothetical protein
MASPKFKHTDRTSFKSQFFDRIGDSSRSFWTDDEANILLNEALYTFGAISQSWKNQIEIKTTVAQNFYDITADLFAEQELTGFNLTYQFILDAINFHLIENISLVNPISEITNLAEILKFARNRVNQYQYETGLILSRKEFIMNPPNDNAVVIDDEVIDIIRVGYIAFDELQNPDETHVLNRTDEDSVGQFYRNAFNETTDIPTFYASILGNLNTIKVYPLPANLGALDIISINGIPASTILALGTKINIPDNLVPYIKWGVLADIYSKDGVAYNPPMSTYCEERWREGVIIGINYSSILEAKLNGLPIQLDSISSLDNNQVGWQNIIDQPSLIALAGYNIFATNCKPDEVYSLLLFSITNAYIPANDDDFIDVKLEYIESLLDYCIHLANVKNGAEMLQLTNNERESFIRVGIKHNHRLVKRGHNFESMMKKVKRQTEDAPVKIKEEVAA